MRNGNDTVIHFKRLQIPGPLEVAQINTSAVGKRFGNAVKGSIYGRLHIISTRADDKTKADDEKEFGLHGGLEDFLDLLF